MSLNTAHSITNELLQSAGIAINGTNPWDIQVHNEKFYARALSSGALGLGEAYMDTWWDCKRLDQFFERIVRAHLENKIKQNKFLVLKILFANLINMQTKKRALEVGKKHYDLNNELFKAMLDSRMSYTCGYWKNATNLETAQLAKLELVCQKLRLKSGMRLLDIGCGWGALAKYAVIKYGVSVVGITISKQQYEYAKENCRGLPIEIRFQDYRELNEEFDRIASLGMFEHVGHLNHITYMQTVRRCLHEQGIFLLHTIGNNQSVTSTDEWTTKYIFPNSTVPSIAQIGKAAEGLLVMEDWHNFGADYDKTLMAWQTNFNQHWETLKNHFDERFYRMWNYFLLSSAGAFRARGMQLWQIVFSKEGIPGGYQAPR